MAKLSCLFSDMADAAILSKRESRTKSTPMVANRVVRTTVKIRAEPFLRDWCPVPLEADLRLPAVGCEICIWYFLFISGINKL